jgi:hypothetical protein
MTSDCVMCDIGCGMCDIRELEGLTTRTLYTDCAIPCCESCREQCRGDARAGPVNDGWTDTGGRDAEATLAGGRRTPGAKKNDVSLCRCCANQTKRPLNGSVRGASLEGEEGRRYSVLELRWPWVEGEDASDQEGTSEGHAELELHQDLAGPVSNGAHQPRAPVLGGRGQYLLRTLYTLRLKVFFAFAQTAGLTGGDPCDVVVIGSRRKTGHSEAGIC